MVRPLLLCLCGAGLVTAQQPSLPSVPDAAAGSSIEGVTLGGNGLPLQGSKVSLEATGTTARDDRLRETESDAFGKFSFPGLDSGTYRLTASHDGLDAYLVTLQSPPQRGVAAVITMTPLAVLTGKVTGEDGKPIAGVMVQPISRSYPVNGRLEFASNGINAETDASGRYRLHITRGRWYFRFSVPAKQEPQSTGPEMAYAITWYPGVSEVSLAAPVEVAENAHLPELNVRLRKTAVYHARGKVSDPSGGNLTITAWPENGEYNISTDESVPVRADGTFDVGGLSPGAWILFLTRTAADSFFPHIPARQPVYITDHDVDDIAIRVRSLIHVKGSLRTISAAPASRPADVVLEPLAPQALTPSAQVERDGTFSFQSVFPTWYRVAVTPPPGGYVKSLLFDGRESIDTGIDLRDGSGSFDLQIVIGTTPGVITGRVSNPDGGPSSGVKVTLLPDGPPASLYRPELHRTVVTGGNGNFTVRDVIPGTYRMYAWERLDAISDSASQGDPLAFLDPEFPRLFDNMSAVVSVAENESKQVSLVMISAAKMEYEARRHR